MESEQDSKQAAPIQSCCPPGACAPLTRREFVALASASLGSLALANAETAFAGPFEAADGKSHPVPADKKLAPAWVAALTARGEPEIYRADALKHVGMPVGGIGCGQLYLGGEGRLWHWDIFQGLQATVDGMYGTGPHYAEPLKPAAPLKQGFALRIRDGEKTTVRTLDGAGFRDVTFRGEYPIGRVTYQDADLPVSAVLEAFSPFIPLNTEDSALPATILQYTLRNTGSRPLEIEIAGWIENVTCAGVLNADLGERINRVETSPQATTLIAEVRAKPKAVQLRDDIVLADFEGDDYAGWKVGGPAFGTRPFTVADRTRYNMLAGITGRGLANSHNSRSLPEKERGTVPGTHKANDLTGTLRSPAFKIDRKYIRFQICGGNYPGKLGVRLRIDGQIVRDVTADFSYQMLNKWMDVSPLQGKQAELEIYDEMKGSWWGFVAVDQVIQSDNLPEGYSLDTFPGYGSLALSTLGGVKGTQGIADVVGELSPEAVFKQLGSAEKAAPVTKDFPATPVGAIGRSLHLGPGESQNVTFLLTWSFPHYKHGAAYLGGITDLEKLHRHHFAKHPTAADVANYVAANFDRLASQTRLWNKTWYDSTLPYWFLDRTFIPLSTLATQTCHWFDNGRFYGWEGVYCCAGTCQHVWQYAQGVARIFPQLERSLRKMVDFGLAYKPSGEMGYRAEHGANIAHDGQLGTVLRFYREHQMSADSEMLKRLWPRVRQAIVFVMDQDKDADGLLEGAQYNTLDATWYGPMAWISSLYLAAVEAGEAMAREMKDDEFARRCAATLEKGRPNLLARLYNGEYFVHHPDPKHPEAINSNEGCHIDQLFGQSYAWQLGLPRIVPAEQSKSALVALWKYNFAPDVDVYRKEIAKTIKGGRWYAMPGEAGLLMCTWPRGGAAKAPGNGDATFVGYFNECMTGFEYQAAGHMIWEGLLTEGLAIIRAIHDRYAATKRNPYNEIECSDHYARAMAGYGAFLAACGYEYHGPEGRLAFAPRWQAENFRCPFTTAEGWGTFSQKRNEREQTAEVKIAWGKLRLTSLDLTVPDSWQVRSVSATLGEKAIKLTFETTGARVRCQFKEPLTIDAAQECRVKVVGTLRVP